ncbi:hypothetical protein LDENG_00014340 [Lucifuga dentata]|nr:hypothetical protein LDENG_00014340 [Lucifuga dentata]
MPSGNYPFIHWEYDIKDWWTLFYSGSADNNAGLFFSDEHQSSIMSKTVLFNGSSSLRSSGPVTHPSACTSS